MKALSPASVYRMEMLPTATCVSPGAGVTPGSVGAQSLVWTLCPAPSRATASAQPAAGARALASEEGAVPEALRPTAMSSQCPAPGRGGGRGLGLEPSRPPPRAADVAAAPALPRRHVPRRAGSRALAPSVKFWRTVVAGNIWTWSKEHKKKKRGREGAGEEAGAGGGLEKPSDFALQRQQRLRLGFAVTPESSHASDVRGKIRG